MKNTSRVIYVALLCAIFYSCNNVKFERASTLAATPIDSMHSVSKNNILSLLHRLGRSDSALLGQNIGCADGNLAYRHMDNLNPKPSILGIDLGYDTYGRDYIQMIAYIENHVKSGGLVTFNMEMPNPYNKKGDHDKTVFDYSLLTDESTSANFNLKTILANIGNLLQRLKDKHIIVLFRPFHEMNGGWYWWGSDKHWPTQQEFQNLWIYTHDYLTKERKLDNILWVYSVNHQYDPKQKSVDYYYPGDQYVDIVGLDYYQDNMSMVDQNGSLSKLSQYKKPIAFSEIGSKKIRKGNFDNNLYKEVLQYHQVSYILIWHSWPNNKMAIEENLNASSLINDGRFLPLGSAKY
jgi:mannan endo-1,4-beta-mannosidase